MKLDPGSFFVVTCAETAFFVGLLIPAEATILVAAFLAERGHFPVQTVLLATFCGGLLGDQIGYALGKYGGTRLVAGKVALRACGGATNLGPRVCSANTPVFP